MLHGHALDHDMDIRQYFEEISNDPHFAEKKVSPNISLQVREVIEKALKFKSEDRASISTLKYQADLYHVNLRQKNTNVAQTIRPQMTPLVQHASKVHFPAEIHSLTRVENENKSQRGGFVSFKNFVADDKIGGQFMKIKQMTSLDDFDADSHKAESSNSRGVAVNPKLNDFIQTTVKQDRFARPISSANMIPIICRSNTVVSSQEIPFLPHHPPLYRHVTVRYS
jgi:hypothetical protein